MSEKDLIAEFNAKIKSIYHPLIKKSTSWRFEAPYKCEYNGWTCAVIIACEFAGRWVNIRDEFIISKELAKELLFIHEELKH